MDLDWVTEFRFQVLKAVKGSKASLTEISEDAGDVELPQTYEQCQKLIELELMERNETNKLYALTDKGRMAHDRLSEVKQIEA